MARSNESDDPWAVPESHPKNRRNIIDKTQALSLNEKVNLNIGDSNQLQRQQPSVGLSVPKSSAGYTFGGPNSQIDSRDRSNKGAGDNSSDSAAGERFFNITSRNSFGSLAQRGRVSTFGGGLPSRKITNSPNIGFRVPESTLFPKGSNFFRPNQPVENLVQSKSMGGFAPPASGSKMERTSESYNLQPHMNGQNEPEEGSSAVGQHQHVEAGSSNRNFSSFPNPSSFSKIRSINPSVADARMQPTFRNEKPSALHQSSLEQREKDFWVQAASRPSAFVPAQPARSPLSDPITAFGGFTPPTSGRPLFGRGFNEDEAAGKGFGIVAPFSGPPSPPPQRGLVADAARCTSQIGGSDENNFWFPKDEYEKPMPNEEISLLNKILHKKLENLQNGSLEVSQARSDPNSPLYSVTSFQSLRLKEELLKALDKMGFTMPSKIQEAALPLLLIEPPLNMIAQAQSGTGKTAAFVLTMLSRVVPENKWPQCLCLAPTYELAMQIGQVVQKMGEFLPEIKIRYAVKGERMSRGEKIEEQIIIGTPGKMLDWVTKLKVIDSSKIICLVLDEADVMISQQGHQDQSIRLHSELEQAGAKYQSLLFSATYDEAVRLFADSMIKDAVNITLRRDEQTLKNIKQYYVKCANREEKYEAVMNLYGGLTIASAIIFCYTRRSAEWLAARMSQRGHDVTVLHGEMTIEERARTIEQFKSSFYKVLITTNVCARGIDVCQVSVVINYDPPVTYSDDPQPDYETYIHRIGRTGRFGKAGIAINLVSDDFALSVIQRIGEYFGVPIEPLDAKDMDQLEAIDNANS